MPHAPELPRRIRCGEGPKGDRGFTLIEVLVAFLVIAIIATAGTSLTIRGMRATMEAKQLGQAKNLVSAQVEQMRGLPYFVSRSTNNGDVDVLDKFYPSTAPAASPTCSADAATWLTNAAGWSGYVAAGGPRCSFEPPMPRPFFRCVIVATNGPCGNPAMTSSAVPTALVVSSQFIRLAVGNGGAADPVAPAASYSASTLGQDAFPSSQMAAQVTAVYGPNGTAKLTTSRTDIADRRAGAPKATASTSAAAVVVDGTLASGEPQRLEIATVAGEGGVTVITKASVEAVGASMQSGASRLDGARALATAPGTVVTSPPGAAIYGGMTIGATQTSGVTANATTSDPGYGSAWGGAASGAVTLDQNRPTLGLVASQPLVKAVSAGPGTMSAAGACPAPITSPYALGAGGWMDTVVTNPYKLNACAQAEANAVQLFLIPTTAPTGLIQVQAVDVIARCEITGTAPTATMSGTLKVRWLTASPTMYSPWSTITLGSTPTGALPPLTTVLAGGKTIGDYVASWDAFSGAGTANPYVPATNTRTAEARIPSALTLTTVALREDALHVPDDDSFAKVTIGQAICSAEDRR